MQVEGVIDRAVEGIADGHAVDWDLLDSQAQDEEERKQLKWLRILEEIAQVHRSTPDPDPEDEAGQATAEMADDDPVEPATAHETWGRYHLLEKVGEGSFGSVYRAWDTQLERELAIKILHRHLTNDRLLRERLLREGRALAKVRQTNVVNVFAVEANEDRVGLCMEFVRGLTLEDVLRAQGTLSARETVLVGEDVCRALAAVHGAGFVHRDVKARNVMREQAGRIVLMDFGTGREVRAIEEANRPDVAGTPLYMAPEVLAGGQASTRSDVYSVGVLLYHMVTAQYPVEAASIDELRAAHRAGRRRYLSECRPDLPMAFIRVIERCLAADPQERYPNAGALLDALGTVLGRGGEMPVPAANPLVPVAVASAVVTCVPLFLGALNSTAFNLTLGRTGFTNETPWDWWVWGVRSSVMPIYLVLVGAMIAALFFGLRRLALPLWAAAARLDLAVRERAFAGIRRLSLDDPKMLSSLVLVLSSCALLFAWWSFRDLIAALFARVATGPLEQLALLAPELEPRHDWYRQAFSYLVVGMAAAWYGVLRLAARKREPLHFGTLAAGAAVLALAIASLDFPYRLLVHNRFDAVRWKGTDCYIMGARGEELLLLCAELAPPRLRAVPKSAEPLELQRLGRNESLYTGIAAAVASSRRGTSPPGTQGPPDTPAAR